MYSREHHDHQANTHSWTSTVIFSFFLVFKDLADRWQCCHLSSVWIQHKPVRQYDAYNVMCIISSCWLFSRLQSLFNYFCDSACSLTREDFACAPSDGDQILDQMLTVGGLAASRLAQHHDGLVLTSGEQVAVRRLSNGVDMRSRVLAPAAFEHVHHLPGEEQRRKEDVGPAWEVQRKKDKHTKSDGHISCCPLSVSEGSNIKAYIFPKSLP